jgi:hypothetical protein
LDVRNVSDKPIELVWTGNLGPLLKVNRDGRNVPRSSTRDAGIYAESQYVLQPGKQAEAWTELLTEEFDLSQPGEYSFQWGDVPAKGRVPPPSNVVTLKLVAAEAASTAPAKQPKWLNGGEWSKSSGGLQTRLSVPDGDRFPAGKPILMRIELRNVGDKPVRYYDTRGYRGGAIKVADHNGKDLPFLVGPRSTESHGPGRQVKADREGSRTLLAANPQRGQGLRCADHRGTRGAKVSAGVRCDRTSDVCGREGQGCLGAGVCLQGYG